MLIPTKHQDLSKNVLVLGADILHYIRKDEYILEELYQELRKEKNIDLDTFLDTITFLWLIDSVNYKGNVISKG
jgi:hypothetical protein